MTDATTPEQPRTAAGRRIVLIYPHLWDGILEIEAQARPAAASEGLLPEQIAHNIVDEFPHIPHAIRVPLEQEIAGAIEAQARPAAASEGLRAALWDADATEVPADDGVTETLFVGTVAEVAERIRAALASDAGRSVGTLDVEPKLGPPERPGWIGVRLRDAFWRDDYYITGKYNHCHPDHTTVAHDYREEACRFTLIEPIYPYDRNRDDMGSKVAAYDAERQGERDVR